MRHETSTLVYRTMVESPLELDDFVKRTPNCVCYSRSRWRCTYYGADYSMNVFLAKRWKRGRAFVCMLFTREHPYEWFVAEFTRLFDAAPRREHVVVTNRVEKFYADVSAVYLERVYESVTAAFAAEFPAPTGAAQPPKFFTPHYNAPAEDYDSDDSDIYRPAPPPPAALHPPVVTLDMQRFSALIVRPFPSESCVTIEVFGSGVLNVAGITSDELFRRTEAFIRDRLVPHIRRHECRDAGDRLTLPPPAAPRKRRRTRARLENRRPAPF